jgi:hypothetical protein
VLSLCVIRLLRCACGAAHVSSVSCAVRSVQGQSWGTAGVCTATRWRVIRCWSVTVACSLCDTPWPHHAGSHTLYAAGSAYVIPDSAWSAATHGACTCSRYPLLPVIMPNQASARIGKARRARLDKRVGHVGCRMPSSSGRSPWLLSPCARSGGRDWTNCAVACAKSTLPTPIGRCGARQAAHRAVQGRRKVMRWMTIEQGRTAGATPNDRLTWMRRHVGKDRCRVK